VDYWRGSIYNGGQEVTVPAPLDGSGPPVFARAGAIIPLAAAYDTLVAVDPSSGLKTWTGDLVVRVMPTGPNGSSESTFTLYDGTRLDWDGAALRVTNNGTPRSIELRTPDGRAVVQQVTGPAATLS
jgi:hypothetical protein